MDKKLAIKNSFDGNLLFGTKNFNRDTGRNSHIDTSQKQISEFFIDPETHLLKQEMCEVRNCPVCGSKQSTTIFIKAGFTHVKCSCGFIFVNPTAKDSFREQFFRDVYETWTQVLITPEQEEIDRKKFRFGLSIIESHFPEKGKVVDIGAGSGLFLDCARESGWQVSGVEFNTKAVEAMQKRGLEVFDTPLENKIYPRDSVDVVALWEVLEHINDPNAFIQQVFSIVKPGGGVFVCVPNIEALVTRILHEKARTFGGSSHVNFFSIAALSKLMSNNGFDLLESDTAISEIGSIKNFLCYEDPYTGGAELDLSFINPQYLYDHNLGSRIFAVFHKRTF